MKRFYTSVTTAPDTQRGGFAILLDGKNMHTPARNVCLAPNERLAHAIAAEWDSQVDDIVPASMPLTQYLSTALDRVSSERAAMQDQVLAYLDSELLCYRAPMRDDGLRATQDGLWGKQLAWLEDKLGSPLSVSDALAPLTQSAQAHAAARAYVEGLDMHRFTVLQAGVSLSGSFGLGMALCEGAIDAAKVYECALCEELHFERQHNIAHYGCDPAEEKRRATLLADLEGAQAYLKLI